VGYPRLMATSEIELHLLRHAHAGDPYKWTGDDADRPLSAKGAEQAEALGRHLDGLGLRFDAIISSPKVRASQTATLVADRLGVRVRIDERLGEPLSLAIVESILVDAGGPQRPILVGHDPDFSELAALLTGATAMPMRKGSLLRIDVGRPIQPGSGIVRFLLPPALLLG
jgi:phosphohistidine phosphatase